MADRDYHKGALEALTASEGAIRRCRTFGPALDALAAMSPEDRAALAAWVWPEGHGRGITSDGASFIAGVRAEAEAATVKRITEWLRTERPAIAGPMSAAKLIDVRFGGPDAAK